jgi:hypothetical protein
VNWSDRYDLKKSLLGRTVEGIYWDSGIVRFRTDAGEVQWETDADCCSQTWIEAADLELCVGGQVTDVEENALPESWYTAHPGPPEEDCLRLYGVTIKTTKGTGTIDFRNESNGYYGGSLVVADARTTKKETP